MGSFLLMRYHGVGRFYTSFSIAELVREKWLEHSSAWGSLAGEKKKCDGGGEEHTGIYELKKENPDKIIMCIIVS